MNVAGLVKVPPRYPEYVFVAPEAVVKVNVIAILELLTLLAENELTFRNIDVV